MKVTAKTITDRQIREMHNAFADGTATDAVGRHLCHVALGECCVGWDGPASHRYPDNTEILNAKERLASHWNRGES